MASTGVGVIALFGVLVSLSALLGLWFVIAFGRPWLSENPNMAWLQSALAAAAVAFDLVLLLALLRVAVPAWVIAAIMLTQDGVFAWRLIALARARRVDVVPPTDGRS